jgi:ComF family protein
MKMLTLWKKSSSLFIDRLSSYFFPPLCLLCDQPRVHHHRWLCGQCAEILLANGCNRVPCPVCAINKGNHSCNCDIEPPFAFSTLVAFFDYDQMTQSIMHQIKYRGKRQLAYDMGYENCGLLPESLFDQIDIAIPIPLHWMRTLSRGYNQAQYFGKGVIDGRKLSIPIITDVVKRTHSTGTQTKLDKISRSRNISDAFSVVKPDMIKGKRILLFDDVVTTGATVNSCAKTLINSGCASVQVCALARD